MGEIVMKNIKNIDFEEKTEPTITAEDCKIQDFDSSEFLKEEHYAIHLQNRTLSE